MESKNAVNGNKDSSIGWLEKIHRDRHRIILLLCLTVGILLGFVTHMVYGEQTEWYGVVEEYCSSFINAFLSVAPVTMGFIVFLFLCAPFEVSRWLIFPAAALRGLGFGALIGGAVHFGSMRELCFASLVLLPYSLINCVVAVYAGEYTLGFRRSFNDWNDSFSDKLYFHAIKMLLLFVGAAAFSCGLFAASCFFFGKYVI